MPDLLPPSAARRANMAAVKHKDSGIERMIRVALFKAGYRYRLHRRDLPGAPDIVLEPYRTVIFVHGCFWHYHDCPHGQRLPKRNALYWKDKLEKNRARDHAQRAVLLEAGYRVIWVWECALKGRAKRPLFHVIEEIITCLDDPGCAFHDISGIV